MKGLYYRNRVRLLTALCGGAFFLSGCDPTLRTAVEDGIINSSTNFLTALLGAAVSVVQTNATSS